MISFINDDGCGGGGGRGGSVDGGDGGIGGGWLGDHCSLMDGGELSMCNPQQLKYQRMSVWVIVNLYYDEQGEGWVRAL